MKIILTISILLIQFVANAQVVRIPDHNFRQRLIALGIDANDDNQIQVSEAQKVTQLYVNDLGIVNLEGISSFTNLEEFGCYNNKLQSLDLSKCKKLRLLYAGNNRIATLNITGLTKLEELFVENNYLLANLDISGLTGLKKVKLMKNKISKLDVSALKELEELEMNDNNIENAVVRGAAKLKLLVLQNNPIKITVDIRGLTELEYCNF